MRFLFATFIALGSICAQVEPQTPATAVPAPASSPEPPVVEVTVAPLAPPDLDSPYASPRDAARQWLQTTLANLAEQRDTRGAIRGFAQAYLMDRTYAQAAFDLGVIAAIEEKWEDAAAALAEASRLDPNGLGVQAKPALERVRLLATLERTPDGRRRRRYDESLYGILPILANMTRGDAAKALALVGRIDPARWEAPALLAGLADDGAGYEISAQFLKIAVKNVTDAAIKLRLEGAAAAADREVRYAAARYSAETAAESGKYGEAADAYESAWKTVPARPVNGMEAACARLLTDDTGRASAVLLQMRNAGDADFSALAASMLKELAAIEPAAQAKSGDDADFFRDRGSTAPPHIADLLPVVGPSSFEIYGRALPPLVVDPEPVVLVSSLSAEPLPAGTGTGLPALGAPAIAGDRPWTELQAVTGTTAAEPLVRPLQAADLGHNARIRRVIQVTSDPPGAKVFSGQLADPVCETPCSLQVAEGKHVVRVRLPGYEEQQQTIQTAGADREFRAALVAVRGSVTIATPAAAQVAVNGTAVSAQGPVTLSLAPGLYRIAAEWSSARRERLLNVKPGAKLKIEWM
ncbi:MAG TPA: PEGA domain-containing protein [Bryobacteraceae bacterium]|nr:PEGA domain-containing protein [Bryobacteraceae bacterium]